MVKVKSSDTLSLDKSKQKKIVKQTKKIKKKIQEGKIVVKPPRGPLKNRIEQNRGLIYIGHIPHGFYENEMKKYFKQFGGVTNVKVCRSNKTGNSKGFGYVEFAHPEVAKIAAETMNNYLMFKKRIVAEFVPSEKRPKNLFKGKSSTIKKYSAKVRAEKQRVANSKIDENTHLKRSSVRLSRLNKKLETLKNAGIDYDFTPNNVPEQVKKSKLSSKAVNHTFEDLSDSDVEVKLPKQQLEDTHEYQQDPFDSDIEVKIPVKRKLGTPKKTPKKVVDKKVKVSNTPKLDTPKKTPRRAVPKKTPKTTSKIVPKQTPKRKRVTRKST